jgi:5'-phosphate synthase pdxT subunit
MMDITVNRNAFGRQVDSFISPIHIEGIEGGAFEGVFIRAPMIKSVGEGVKIVAKLEDGTIVAARQDNMFATSFHPELTKDTRVHQLFVRMITDD